MLTDQQLKELELQHYRPTKRATLEQKLGNNIHYANLTACRELRIGQAGMFDFSTVICGNNVQAMNDLFGKHEGVYRYEYNNYFWRFLFKGYVMTVFSAAGKGTSIEVNPDPVEETMTRCEDATCEFIKVMFNLWKPYHEELLAQIADFRNEEAR